MIGTGFLFQTHWDKNTFIPSGKHHKNKIMYDLSYVKKRRRKKIAALVSLFTAVGITSLVIISFLGRTVGTFSVKLTNSDVKLSLSEKISFKDATSYLHFDSVPSLRETTFTNLPSADYLDNEDTPVMNDETAIKNEKGEIESIYFIKYTFYIRNVGNSIARYNLSINITDSQKSNDGTNRYVDDTLRIMVYENDPAVAGSHDFKVYAKESDQYNYDKDGNRTMREFVSIIPSDHKEDPANGYILADSFISSSVAARYEVGNFAKNDVMRYTLVVWLEGEDPDTDNSDEPPEGATLKLGVDIAAYENA